MAIDTSISILADNKNGLSYIWTYIITTLQINTQ